MSPVGIATKHAALVLSLAVVIGILTSACGKESALEPTFISTPGVQVITTIAILADFVRNVGGDRVDVQFIIPPGSDVHSFQATPKDSIAISRADVIFSNGMGLDDFLDSLIESARRLDAVQMMVTEGLEAAPLKVAVFPSQIQERRDVSDNKGNPHFWQNPLYAIHYVERIRDGLIEVDPAGDQTYQVNATAYIREIQELDQEIAQILSAVPPQQRRLVTFHDAFGYFAERYGWQVSAFVPDDASDVTPGNIVKVMDQVREEGILAVFAEPQFSPDVMEQAARDAGVSVGTIYSDALDGDVVSYIDMMRFNARSLAENLR